MKKMMMVATDGYKISSTNIYFERLESWLQNDDVPSKTFEPVKFNVIDIGMPSLGAVEILLAGHDE